MKIEMYNLNGNKIRVYSSIQFSPYVRHLWVPHRSKAWEINDDIYYLGALVKLHTWEGYENCRNEIRNGYFA